MKVNDLFMQKLTLGFMLLLVLSGGCKNPYDPDGNGGVKPDSIPMDCKVMANVVKMPYGSSIYGNLWFKTGDGQTYLPCQKSFITQGTLELQEGDRVRFGYRNLPPNEDCLKDLPELALMDAIPLNYQPVSIDCIQLITKCGTTPTPCYYLQIDNKQYQDEFATVLECKMIGSELKVKIGYSGCSPLTNASFKLVWNGSLLKSSPPQAVLHVVTDKVNQTNCEAYFVNELCFDVQEIKKRSQQPVLLHIGKHQIRYQ